MGLLIMFRLKTGPQTIVTIQNAIPKIITTLILVSFSYAIAGLAIDLMNLIQSLVIATLFTVQGIPFTGELFPTEISIISPGQNIATFGKLSQLNLGDLTDLTLQLLPLNTLAALGSLIGALIGFLIPGMSILAALAGAVIGPILMTGIVCIIVLIWQLKFFFGLIMAYLNVIIKIILSPFEIGIGAIPGMKIGFSSWITQLLGHLAVFPISALFITLANVIVTNIQDRPGQVQDNLWLPSLMSPNNIVSAVTSLSGGLPAAAIGLGAIFLLSKLPKMIPEFIFQIKPSPYGTAIGEAAKGIPGTVGQASGLLHTVSGVNQDWSNIFGRKEQGPIHVIVDNREDRPRTRTRPHTQSKNDAEIPSLPKQPS